jgi:hypothetical protein
MKASNANLKLKSYRKVAFQFFAEAAKILDAFTYAI